MHWPQQLDLVCHVILSSVTSCSYKQPPLNNNNNTSPPSLCCHSILLYQTIINSTSAIPDKFLQPLFSFSTNRGLYSVPVQSPHCLWFCNLSYKKIFLPKYFQLNHNPNIVLSLQQIDQIGFIVLFGRPFMKNIMKNNSPFSLMFS